MTSLPMTTRLRPRPLLALLLSAAFAAGCNESPRVDPGIQNLVSEPPGERCPHGGVAIQRGDDADRDGKLSAGEVAGTVFMCNGAPGSGSSLAAASAADCPTGGFVYSANGASTALCNGAAGQAGSAPAVQVGAASPASCPGGGLTLTVNGVASTVCNGVKGDGGAAGVAPSVSMQAATSVQCPSGGVVMRVDGTDTVICSGLAGSSGQAPVVSVLPVASGAGSPCVTGGLAVTVNGVETLVCNGAPGASGTAPTATLSAASPQQCAHGGMVLTVAGQPTALCAGAPGAAGVDRAVSVAPATTECARGGVVVTVDGQPTSICNAEMGPSGATPQVSVAVATPQQCVRGGLVLSVNGVDTSVCNGKPGAGGTAFTVSATVDTTRCPSGGVVITVNSTDTLICNGNPGLGGVAPAVSTAAATAQQCPAGGVVLTVNGTDRVLCAGEAGAAGTTPAVTSVTATSQQCPHGGIVVTVGTTSTPLCNAAPGADGVGSVKTAAAGAECPAGGLAITVSGVKSSICNGITGAAGNAGIAPTVTVASATFAECPTGGAVVTINSSVIPVCNGERGAPGGPVTVNIGAATQAQCPTGGSVFTFDGTSTPFCNGATGQSGPSCDATNCPTGCCNNGTCVAFAGQGEALCGAGGSACGACGSTEICRSSPTGGACTACEVMPGNSPTDIQTTARTAWKADLAMPCIETTNGVCTTTGYDPNYEAVIRIAPGTYSLMSGTTPIPILLQGPVGGAIGCGPTCTCPAGQPDCDLSAVTGCPSQCYIRTNRDQVVPANIKIKTCQPGVRPTLSMTGSTGVIQIGGPDAKSMVAATVEDLIIAGTTAGIAASSAYSVTARRNRFTTGQRGFRMTNNSDATSQAVLIDNEFTGNLQFGTDIAKNGNRLSFQSENGYGNTFWHFRTGAMSWSGGLVQLQSPTLVYLNGGTNNTAAFSTSGIYTLNGTVPPNSVLLEGGFNVSTATLSTTTMTAAGDKNEGLDPDTLEPLMQVIGNVQDASTYQFGLHADKTVNIGIRNLAFSNVREGIRQVMSSTSTHPDLVRNVIAANIRMSGIYLTGWYRGLGTSSCEPPELSATPQRSMVFCGNPVTSVVTNPTGASAPCPASSFTACADMSPAYVPPTPPNPFPTDTTGLNPPGLPCASSADCANGQSCCPMTGAQVCSTGGASTPTIANGICIGLGLNQKCFANSQCASGNCNTSINKCIPPSP